MPAAMLKAALHRFGHLGFVGALLLAMATVALPFESRACTAAAPEAVAAGVQLSAGLQTDPCAPGDCGDCATVCAHGCCHAPHVGVMTHAAGPSAPRAVSQALVSPEPRQVRLAPVSALERPPRA
jgi:hypothetical protein